MALLRVNVGTNPDGSPRFHYQSDGSAPVVITGPISGTVTTSDGTRYDVTDDVIEVESHAHAGEVSHAIGVRHETEIHPDHLDGEPFVHECTDPCGGLKRG